MIHQHISKVKAFLVSEHCPHHFGALFNQASTIPRVISKYVFKALTSANLRHGKYN